jgi:hypothetical protein
MSFQISVATLKDKLTEDKFATFKYLSCLIEDGFANGEIGNFHYTSFLGDPYNSDYRGKLCSPEERIDIPCFTFSPAEIITERGRTKTYSSFEKGRVDPCANEDFKPRVVATGMVALVIHTFRWDRYEREEAMGKYLSGTCCQYLEGTHDSAPWHNKSRLTDRMFADIYTWYIKEERARINQSEGIYEYFTKTEQEEIRQRVKEANEYVGTYFSNALKHIELSFDDLAEYFPQFVGETKALANKFMSTGFLVDGPGMNSTPYMNQWVDLEMKASRYRTALLNDTCTAPRTITLKEIVDNVPGTGQEIIDNMRKYMRLYETYKDSFRELLSDRSISAIGSRLMELDEACKMTLSKLERYYGIPTETQEAQPQQKEVAKQNGQINTDRLKGYFVSSFTGLGGNNEDYFSNNLIPDLDRLNTSKDKAVAAALIYDSKEIKKASRPNTFKAWLRIFFDCLGGEVPTYNKSKLSDKQLERMFYYLHKDSTRV